MVSATSTAQFSWEYLHMKRKERAAGYPRVSDENLKDSPTLESQEKAIREYIESHGYEYEEKYMYPEAMTAYLKPYHERKIFMEMVAAAKRREFKEEASRNNKWPKDVLLRVGHVRCGVCNAKLRVKNVHGSYNGTLRLNRYMCDRQVGVLKHAVNIGAKTLDEAAWEFAMQYIVDPSLIRMKLEELRSQAKVHIDTESVEKITAGIKKKLKNLYTLAQDATDDETLDSNKALMHDWERQKHEAEAMLYEVAEEEETMKEVNAAIDRFEAWAGNVRRYFVDPEYVPTYEEKRLAINILGVQATVWPVGGQKRYELTLAPPSVVSLLCG